MILRKGVKALFLLLLLALSLVPVLQAAHALTHLAPEKTVGIAESGGGQGAIGSVAEADTDAEIDAAFVHAYSTLRRRIEAFLALPQDVLSDSAKLAQAIQKIGGGNR